MMSRWGLSFESRHTPVPFACVDGFSTELGEFISIHIPGDLNVSDYFTKDLPVARHEQLIDRIIHVPSAQIE